MARDEIGPVGGAAALIAVFAIMIILLAVLALVVVNALARVAVGHLLASRMTIPIALFMGFYLRVLRPGRVIEATAIGVALLLLAIVAGGWVAGERRRVADCFTLEPETLVLCLVGLRLRRLGAAGVDAARAARLPVDLHEDRHDRAAGGRHRRDAAR